MLKLPNHGLIFKDMSWADSKTQDVESWEAAPSSVLLGKMYIFGNKTAHLVSPSDKQVVIKKEVRVKNDYVQLCMDAAPRSHQLRSLYLTTKRLLCIIFYKKQLLK